MIPLHHTAPAPASSVGPYRRGVLNFGLMPDALSRRMFLSSLAAPALLSAQTQSKPNIIFVLADDLGFGDLGCFGQQLIQTPNIDRLATEGMRFTDAYAGSTVCAPSRCCLMTGFHTGHALVRGNGNRPPLGEADITVAEALKPVGYKTGCFGKWALGEAQTSGVPNLQGFDEFYGYYSQTHAHTYYPTHLWRNMTYQLIRENRGARQDAYSHDLVTDAAFEWIDTVAGDPFFCYLAYTIPHADNELGADTGDGQPVPDYGIYADKPWPNPEKGFAAMITRMDRDVGRLMDLLQQKGVDENTLIIFSSDNGPHKEGGHSPNFFESQGGLRGIKRDFYEGGIRVPTLARWPGKVKAGSVSAHPWANWDFLATACELAGVKAPPTDGVSIVPTLLGKPQKEHEYLYWEMDMPNGGMQAVRMGKWKGVRYAAKTPIEVYDLSEDLAERNDLAKKHPEIVKRVEEAFRDAHVNSPHFPLRGVG